MSIEFWIGAQGIFINRGTEGTIDLGDLSSNTSRPDLENIVNETAAWCRQLPTPQKEVVHYLAEKTLDKLKA